MSNHLASRIEAALETLRAEVKHARKPTEHPNTSPDPYVTGLHVTYAHLAAQEKFSEAVASILAEHGR